MLVFKYLDRNQNGSQLLSADYFHNKNPDSHLGNKGLARSSICEAREKLSWEVFPYLLSQVPQQDYKWRGHTLRAVDGTYITLTRSEEILEKFPLFNNHFGQVSYPVGHLVAASNLLTGQITNVIFGNKHTNEANFLKDLLCQFKPGDISILDRGYSIRSVWHAFNREGQYFVGRLNFKRTGIKDFDPNKKEQIVEVLDIDSDDIMQVRILRGAKLKTGNYFYIVTNLLDKKKYRKSELLNLYKKRIGIEKNFEELKNRLGLSGAIKVKKLNSVLQEIFAAILAQSLVAAVKNSLKISLNKIISFKATQRLIKLNLLKRVTYKYATYLEDELRCFYHIFQPDRQYPRYSMQAENKWIKERRLQKYVAKKRLLRT